MLARLKRSLRRVEEFLAGLFRSRSRKHNISLDHMDWDGLRALTGVLDQNTDAFGPLTPAVTTLSACIEAFDDQARSREEYGTLRTDLNDLLRLLSVCLNGKTNPSEATKRRIANLARGIEKETEPLSRRMEQNEVERDGKDMGDTNEVLQAYRRMRALLGRFMLNESTRMWKIPGQGVPDTHLDHLSHPAAAWYDSTVPDSPRRNGCTPNTRVDVLKELRNWTSYNNHPNLYWLNGSAGTGKTTIAYSLCEDLENSGRLAASFFCARWSPECRDGNTILPSISHQLSSFSRPFRYAISDIVDKDVDVQTLRIDEQFELLIAAPLRKIGYTLPAGVTIVIDGLNECEDDDGGDQILKVLLAHAAELPVRFLVVGRPEPKIADRMQNERGGGTFLEKSLDDIDPSAIRADIKAYMGAELATANPTLDNLGHLCELSGALFECAAVFVRYVMRGYLLGGTERIRRMQRLLSAPTSSVDEGDERMDPAYFAFLEAALEVDAVGGPDRAEINRVLRTVICAREPLTVDTLAGLLGMSVARLVRYPLQALHLILEISNTSGFVNSRHMCFPKYLLDQNRSGRLYCDADQHNVWLANTCFDLIRVSKGPDSNNNSKPSHPRDQRQSDHGKIVLPELIYAYRHCTAHLELVEHSKALAVVERLKQWLDTCTTSEADTFFNALLQVVLDKDSSKSAKSDHMIAVLHTLVCAQETLTVDALSNLLMLDGDLIRLLTPALLISATTGHVTVLHDSLSTFMLDQKRSGKFHCNARQHNAWLARRAFEMMKEPNPPFNICNLESSYLLDSEVPDLKERVEKAISPGLLYACRYWKAHLTLASPIGDLLDTLYEFLSTRLLLWMEILNLSGRMGEGTKALSRLSQWLQSIECPDTTRELVLDARKFFVTFSFSPISDSTPQIYTSLLPFWPEHRPMAQYLRRTPGVVKVKCSDTNAVSIAKFDTIEDLRCFVCSPSGEYIACADLARIRIYDTHSGQPVGQPLKGHTYWVSSVAYSPDGAYIASGSRDKTIQIWDAHTRQPVGQPLRGHTYWVNSVAYSPNGAYIVSGSADKTIRIWDARTGQPVGQPLEGHTDWINSVAYSPDGAYIASGSSDNTIRIWDARTGQPVGHPLEGHTGWINSVAYSPDGAYIASGSNDKTIRIWDGHTRQPMGQPLEGHFDVVNSLAYSPDGAHIASASCDKTIRIWDAHTGQPVGQPLEGHAHKVQSVAYLPASLCVVSGSDDGTIRIWDAHTGQPVGQPPKGHTNLVSSVAYSPDGAYIASGSYDNTIRIWGTHTGQPVGQPLEGHTYSVKSVAYSPDGAYIASGSDDWTIRIWDAHTGQLVGQPLNASTSLVTSVAYSPDGAYIASGSDDGAIRIWDAHTRQPVGQPLKGHTFWVRSIAYSPDSAYIVAGSAEETIRIWDARTGQPVGQPLEGHTAWVNSVAYSPDGAYIASGSSDNTIRIWDAPTGQPVGHPLEGHTGWINSVAYSPDGAYIASGSNDKTIRIWDAHTRRPAGLPLEGHTGAVTSVAYSPDGAFIVSGSDDKTIRTWTAKVEKPVEPLAANSRQLIRAATASPHDAHTSPSLIQYHPSAIATSSDPTPNQSSEPKVATMPHGWTLNEEGWVVNANHDRLLWVPRHARATLVRARGLIVIGARGHFALDFHAAKLGEDWTQCFDMTFVD